MDEEKLKDVLQNMPVPPPHDNARKRALTFAVAEFKAHQKEKKKSGDKSSQGISFLSRPTKRTTSDRSNPMDFKFERKEKQRFVFSGMATALAVVLIVGVTFNQLQKGPGVVNESDLALQQSSDSPEKDMGSGVKGTELSIREIKQKNNPQNIKKNKQPMMIEGYMPIVTPPKDIQKKALPPTPPSQAQPPASSSAAAALKTMAPQEASNEMAADSAIAAVAGAAPAMMAPPTPIVTAEEAQAEMKANPARTRNMRASAQNYVAGLSNGSIISDSVQKLYEDGLDKFKDFDINPIKLVSEEPISTFSIDVDTASYSFMRRQLNSGMRPLSESIRIEELINYFDYDYALPDKKDEPFKPSITVTDSPWSKDKKIIHIGIKGFDIQDIERPPSNLVFLLDVSGSMNEPDKLPLLKNSMKMLLDTLDKNDKVSIVVYAGAAGTVLEPTAASEKEKIIAAIDNLAASGSTAGAEGINLAYQLAEQNFNKEGVNRIILATDGDFNVGASSDEDLKSLITKKRESGIFLSVLGFGQGNLNDSLMQTLAQNGNGTAAYIDSLNEARKVLVDESTSTLFTIAKDVKIQVDFNPATVSEYRLIGYETRALEREDFNNDKVDAGDIGAGHAVTAIYEITPVGAKPSIEPSRYEITTPPKPAPATEDNFKDEYAFLKIRYKLPNEDTSKLISTPVNVANNKAWECPPCPVTAACAPCQSQVSNDTGFAIAVASFGQLLKDDPHLNGFGYNDVINMAQKYKGDDPFGYRAEFINLVRLAKTSPAQ